MLRQAVAVFTAIVFVVFSSSCMTWRNKEIRTSADYPAQQTRILTVVKRSGEVVEFSRTAPARVVGNQVVGTTSSIAEREVEIEGPFPLIKRQSDGTVTEVTDAKGRVWSVRSVLKEEPNRMTIRVVDSVVGPVAIPLSDIRQITNRKTDVGLTILALLGAGGLVFLVWGFSTIKD
jgi:hypothetical protein